LTWFRNRSGSRIELLVLIPQALIERVELQRKPAGIELDRGTGQVAVGVGCVGGVVASEGFESVSDRHAALDAKGDRLSGRCQAGREKENRKLGIHTPTPASEIPTAGSTRVNAPSHRL